MSNKEKWDNFNDVNKYLNNHAQAAINQAFAILDKAGMCEGAIIENKEGRFSITNRKVSYSFKTLSISLRGVKQLKSGKWGTHVHYISSYNI